MQALHRLSIPTGPESVSNSVQLRCLPCITCIEMTCSAKSLVRICIDCFVCPPESIHDNPQKTSTFANGPRPIFTKGLPKNSKILFNSDKGRCAKRYVLRILICRFRLFLYSRVFDHSVHSCFVSSFFFLSHDFNHLHFPLLDFGTYGAASLSWTGTNMITMKTTVATAWRRAVLVIHLQTACHHAEIIARHSGAFGEAHSESSSSWPSIASSA